MHPATPPPDTPASGQLSPDLSVGKMAALVTAIGSVATALVLTLVPAHEGTVLWGYRDIGGVITACTGNTSHAMLGRRYTAEECRALLAADLVKHAKDLDCITTPLKPHEKAGLLSFAFTVGPGKPGLKDGLCVLKDGRQTTIRRLANAGDMAGACAAISEWTGVQGRDCRVKENRCSGIVKRRAAERAMCEGRYLGGPAAGVAP